MVELITCRNGRRALLAVLVLLGSAGCTTVEDTLDDIATARIFPVDVRLAWQSLDEPERIQVAIWTLQEATLRLDDAQADLRIADPCKITDTVYSFPSTTDRCGAGLVIEPREADAPSIELTVRLTMLVHRAVPPDLPAGADYDGDGVPNGFDICPLVPNRNQEDADSDGFGDACSLVNLATLETSPDADGDGISNPVDNCVWESNPNQEDTDGPAAEGIPDGIGDACEFQEATVYSPAGSTELERTDTIDDSEVPRDQLSYVTVDFTDAELTCAWGQSRCTLDPNDLKFCLTTDLFSAASGCP